MEVTSPNIMSGGGLEALPEQTWMICKGGVWGTWLKVGGDSPQRIQTARLNLGDGIVLQV
jgi:hypothetical protein